MNLMDALKSRRSIRRYQSRPIPKDLAESLIDAAQTAPSAGNLSARRYVLVSNEDMRRLLTAAAYGQEHIEEAPLLIAVCADSEGIQRPLWQPGRPICHPGCRCSNDVPSPGRP